MTGIPATVPASGTEKRVGEWLGPAGLSGTGFLEKAPLRQAIEEVNFPGDGISAGENSLSRGVGSSGVLGARHTGLSGVRGKAQRAGNRLLTVGSLREVCVMHLAWGQPVCLSVPVDFLKACEELCGFSHLSNVLCLLLLKETPAILFQK